MANQLHDKENPSVQPEKNRVALRDFQLDEKHNDVIDLDPVTQLTTTPLAERILENTSAHELKEKEAEKQHARKLQNYKAITSLVLVTIVTIFILLCFLGIVIIGIILIMNPNTPETTRNWAGSAVTFILGGAMTLLLSKLFPYLEKKD